VPRHRRRQRRGLGTTLANPALQQYCWQVLPTLGADGNLPPGEHGADWADIEHAFTSTPWRRYLLDGLRRACAALAAAGCTRLWLDGSFVTDKELPADFDGCWDPAGVDPALLDPVLLDFTARRAAQKAKYGGELFPSTAPAGRHGRTFVQFFQVDKHTGYAKGIVVLDPRSAP